MKNLIRCLLATAALAIITPTADAGDLANRIAYRHARGMAWNAPYYHTARGGPIALVVPPNVNMQVRWGWGVAQSSSTPIYHQFYRRYPGEYGAAADVYSPTPYHPSHTDQFGVYYVRGPW